MRRKETISAHAGTEPDPLTGAITPPIHFATTFERDASGGLSRGYIYSREAAPTRTLFENALTDLEGGAECCAFSSGMAAANALFQSLRPGDRVLIPADVYHGLRVLAREVFAPWGLVVEECDFSDERSWSRALDRPAQLVWLETPSNPRLRITDLAAVIARARQNGGTVAVDGTWTTPLLQRPLELGADIVVHSVTKYIGGHSDVLGGALVTGDAELPLFRRIRAVQKGAGAVMDPFSAWLALRGMRSLAPRLYRQCDAAERIAAFLDAHDQIDLVHYPGLASHPGHDAAARQMSRFGAMLSVEHAGGERGALEMAARLKLFRRATSLGGTESLVEHRASVEPAPSPTPRSLLRFSVGLEHVDDLLEDLEQALSPR